MQGSDKLDHSPIDPPGHSREVIPKAFRAKLKALFDDPKIAKALE